MSRLLLLTLLVALLAINVFAVSVETESEETSFLMVDVDNDGEADLKLSASVAGGAYDTIEHLSPEVTNQKAKAKLLDVDSDGVADLRLVDSNKDGLYDQIIFLEQTPTADIVPINPADPVPTDAPVLKQPIIFPPPPKIPTENGVTFGPIPPANLTKPVIIDNTIPLPPLPRRRHRCGCRNATKPKQYRNDVQYRLKKKHRKHRPCPCAQKNNTTNSTVLPPIVAKLYPPKLNITNVTRCWNATKKKKVVKLAPEYRLPKRQRKVGVLQPCNKNSTKNATATIRPELRRLTRQQRKLTNVSFAN